EVSRIRRDRRLDAGGRTPSSSPGRRGIPLRLADLPSDDWPQVDAGLLLRLLDWAVSNARRRRTLLFEQQRRRLFLEAFVVRQAGRCGRPSAPCSSASANGPPAFARRTRRPRTRWPPAWPTDT